MSSARHKKISGNKKKTTAVKNYTSTSMMIFFIVSTLNALSAMAQDITMLGGELSTDLVGHNALQVGAPNISSSDRRDRQLTGFSVFHRAVLKSEGLGPRFINNSCGGCHVENGKGPIKFNSTFLGGSTAIVKVSLNGLAADGSPKKVPNAGLQLLDHSTTNENFYKIRLYWEQVSGRFPDSSTYKLRKPRVTFSIPHVPRKYIRSSLRMSPQLIGLGLLEAIPESSLLEQVDINDRDSDGISGKANYVPDVLTKTRKIGRFGFKATSPTVAQQSASAALNDMGLTNPLFPGKGNSKEISDDQFERLVLYQMIPGVPMARDQNDPIVQKGKVLFQQIGCAKCHTMTFVTGESPLPELSFQTIHPFTDLLLHDMGSELSDGRPDFLASGSEWRTAPLWGLGFAESVSDERALYLHDGRARTIQEAILWHGGEGARSRNQYKSLSRNERESLLRFLRAL